MRTKETYELIQDIVDEMSFTFIAKEITDNGSGTFKLTTCDTLYLQVGYSWTIDSIVYKITSVVQDEYVIVKGATIPTSYEIIPYPIYFFHGTIIAANQELQQETDASSKYPCVYLLETLSEVFDKKFDSATERTSNLRLFFLTQASHKDWGTDDAYDNAIKQMRKINDEFLITLEEHRSIGLVEQATTTPMTKFGSYLDNKGYEKNFFNDETAGVGLTVEIPFMKRPCEEC